MVYRVLIACGILIVPVAFLAAPIIAPIFSGSPILGSSGEGGGGSTTGFSEDSEGELRSDRPTIRIFTASWCPPCKMMKAEVYPSSAVQEVAERLNWVFVDVDKPENKEMAMKYGVRGIPSFFLEDVSGKVVASSSGGTSAENFRAFLDQGL